jgi:hypothetical protein
MQDINWEGYFSNATLPALLECERLLKEFDSTIQLVPLGTTTRRYAVLGFEGRPRHERPEGKSQPLRFEERPPKKSEKYVKVSFLAGDQKTEWEKKLRDAGIKEFTRNDPQREESLAFQLSNLEETRRHTDILRDIFHFCLFGAGQV